MKTHNKNQNLRLRLGRANSARPFGGRYEHMKPILIFLMCLTLSTQVNANVESYVSPEFISVSGVGTYGDKYSLKFSFRPSTKGTALSALELIMVYGTYSSKNEKLADVYDPIISKIEIANDSGINGSYYTFTLRYGETLSCNEKMVLKIEQPFMRDTNDLELTKINPCNENS